MKTRVSNSLVILLLTAVVPAAFAAEDAVLSAKALSRAFRDAAHKVLPAVISISAEKRAEPITNETYDDLPEIYKQLFPKDYLENIPLDELPDREWQGSGVIISPEGEAITNFHVVKDADALNITLDDGSETTAHVIASDEYTDLALIQLDKTGPYPHSRLGDSDRMEVGDWVLAIGNPFGLRQSVSEGIISAKGRTNYDVPVGGDDHFIFKDFIQTTAAINPGNSGGALINLDGEVIGINNSIQTAGVAGNLGIGFAIPSNLANNVISDLKTFQKVRRGYLGVEMSGDLEIVKSYKEKFNINHGVLIDVVRADTPAALGGLQNNDFIIKINSERVRDNGHLQNIIIQYPVDSEVAITVMRGEEEITRKVVLAERPPEQDLIARFRRERDREPLSPSQELLGLTLETLTPEVAEKKGYAADLKGVYVTDATGDTVTNADIQPGDVISEIDGTMIESVEAFDEALSGIKEKMIREEDEQRSVLLYVHRAGARLPRRFVAPSIHVDLDANTEE